jgi:HEAT repeat protein
MWLLLILLTPFGLVEPCAVQEPLPAMFQGRPLADWVKDLHSKEAKVRLPAIALMGALGDQAREHIPRLRELLREGDVETRLAVINALGRMAGDEAFAALLTASTDQEPLVLQALEGTLNRRYLTPRARVEVLLRLRFHPDVEYSRAALDALRRPGAWRLEAVPILVGMLSHTQERLCREACDTLAYFGPDAKEAVPALVRLLENPAHQYDALHALGRIAQRPDLCVPALTALFRKQQNNANNRIDALQTLRRFGPSARAALPALQGIFNDLNPQVRFAAAETFLALGGPANMAVPVLAELVNYRDKALRLRAVQVLADLGPMAQAALPALRKALDDYDATTRTAARRAIGKISP